MLPVLHTHSFYPTNPHSFNKYYVSGLIDFPQISLTLSQIILVKMQSASYTPHIDEATNISLSIYKYTSFIAILCSCADKF